MRVALAEHDEVMRTVIEGHEGFLFSHTGDGVVAAFASPRSAVDAAVAAQRALELPVRMGIATGEAELRDGDYFGTVLNRTARVMASGHGGQILVADSTATFLGGVDLVNLGPRRLRDLPNPITLFQLRAAGLPTDFPPLRTLDSSPGNFRPPVNRLIGRDSEVGEFAIAVRMHRVVTLTGPGGVGKTRLAIEIANQIFDEFPDGVWLFELAACVDPGAVPDVVATVLGVAQQPGHTVTESVAAALEGRARLLVFDNCEHVRDATADLVEAILAHSNTVRILTTSREGLGVVDEQLRLVPSLEVGPGVDSAAATLFLERASSVAAQFSVDEDGEAAAVVEICRRLDGIPLAIELAASRMASMTASDVRDRLDNRFRLLIGSPRALERHQTLRHAVAWSFDLLSDTERALLDRCSVFTGGFDVESACAVAGAEGIDDYAVLDLLDALVRKSLLVVGRSAGRARFSMLETVRQFAEEQLAAEGDLEVVRRAHARHFAARLTNVLALWDSPRQREAYTWFTTELPNLRTAFRWARAHDEVDVAALIACYTGFYGYVVENYEPVAWAEAMIEPAAAVDHPQLAFLYMIAAQCYSPGRIEQAVRYADACQLVGSSGERPPFGLGGGLGAAYSYIGQGQRWVEWCRAELTLGRDSHGYTRACLVVALTIAGCGEDARETAEGLADAAEATDNPFMLAFALMADGFAFSDADPARALRALRRALVIARNSGNRFVETLLVGLLSRLEVEQVDPLATLDHLALLIHTYHEAGNATTIRVPMAILAAFFDRHGIYEPAATLSGFAFDPFSSSTVPEINTAVAHLREVVGGETYESLVREGAAMSVAAMVAYAHDQIDKARTRLKPGAN
jgi:predicted ATPase